MKCRRAVLILGLFSLFALIVVAVPTPPPLLEQAIVQLESPTPVLRVPSGGPDVVLAGDEIQVGATAQPLQFAVICGPAMRLQWQSTTGQHYVVEVSTNLVNWQSTHVRIVGSGGKQTFYDVLEAPQKFYRLKLQ